MRIIVDTNVILSAIYKRGSLPDRVLRHVCDCHELVLCDHIVSECYEVVKRRFPAHIAALNDLFADLSYELIAAPRTAGRTMADPKDQPILNAAILHEVDIIISGDKHFLQLDLERPKTVSPAEFWEAIPL